MGAKLQEYLKLHIIVHPTCPYTPQQNGVAVKKNRHLLKMGCASLLGGNMHISY